MSSLANSHGLQGQQEAADSGSDFNVMAFIVKSILSQVCTSHPVQVISCTNSGGLSPVGFVDLQLLINQVDGAGNATPRGIIYKCPYSRLQGGANAVIIDPEVGDKGVAVFAARDASSVIANKGQANPGSARQFDMADAFYVGWSLNAAPTQYVQFSQGGAGIKLHSPTLIDLEAPDVQINCSTLEINASTSVTITTPAFHVIAAQSVLTGEVTHVGLTVLDGPLSQSSAGGGGTGASLIGPLTVTNDVTAEGKSLATHVHSGVQSGGSDTGAPV